MDIDLSMRHGAVPADLQSFVSEKVERLEKYLKDSSRIEVVVERDHDLYRCEAILHPKRRGNNIVAHDSHADVHASVDGVLEKIRAALVKLKDRRKDHHRGHGLGEELAALDRRGESVADEPSYEEIVERSVRGDDAADGSAHQNPPSDEPRDR